MIWISRLFAVLLLLVTLACPAQETGSSDADLRAQLENISPVFIWSCCPRSIPCALNCRRMSGWLTR
jgi:hypothetical protein